MAAGEGGKNNNNNNGVEAGGVGSAAIAGFRGFDDDANAGFGALSSTSAAGSSAFDWGQGKDSGFGDGKDGFGDGGEGEKGEEDKFGEFDQQPW